MKKYLFTSFSILLFFCSQNSFAQSKKDKQDTTKNQEQPIPIKEYYKSGKLKVEGFVKNNRYDSTFISYYENGQIEAQGSFNDCVYKTNNTTIKTFPMDYADDTLKIIFGRKNGDWKYFYQNGIPKRVENYFCDIKTGMFINYYPSGIIKRRTFYSENREVEDTEYYENGNISELCIIDYQYKLDDEDDYIRIRYDKIVEYYETGELAGVSNAVNDEFEGKYIEFWANGFPMLKQEYKNDLLEGESSEYYENGNTKFIGLFKSDKQEGKHYHYNEEGKITKIETWKNGELIKTEIPKQE
ncbi:hypothetical protein Fleli_0624 [Bernardetia litoralis DSM 6794]|uniref:MORN repeat protein n=1 Tax=Bernardetia litoralis (strain ATCC 23117 / DSM 6794 / NBRC 15988 / NCIMB 1366 / Fx l1 / Sio-4) TaxID=880071 RepID=I4AGK3_BERLS|nr:hypothetical protein [Bernardetia litoralis]AFM03088.1 hypothetical protein Fleli_0624 [Bernardetia litoralis DSM 6794]